MKKRSPQIARFVCALLAVSIQLLGSTGVLAASLTVSPPSASVDYSGQIALNITGLVSGQSVVVEKFADLNGNNTIDALDVMVQSFRVTDGQVASVAGVRNRNVPGDDDGGANGQIQTPVNFRTQEAERGVGRYLYRVSSTTSGFAPVTAAFTVSQRSDPQRVTGRVLSGASGLAYAFVVLLSITEDRELITAAGSDASGNFILNAPSGTYLLAAFKSGHVFDFENPPVVTVQAGMDAAQNIALSAAGNRRISGRVLDEANGAGVPGIQVFAMSSSGLATLVLSDANGDFTAPISSSVNDWELEVSDRGTMLLGYLEPDGVQVNTSTGNVTGLNLRLTKGTALIYGRLVDYQNRPVSGVPIRAYQYEMAGNGVTDAEGNYCASVTAGEWYVQPEEESQAALGLVVQGGRVTLQAGQSRRTDLAARRVTAHLRGRVVDEFGTPVAEIGFGASDLAGSDIYPGTDRDGIFDIGLFGGTWHLQLTSEDAQERGLIGLDSAVPVLDDTDVTGITYVVRRATANIHGSLRDGSGQPLANVHIYASASVSGQTYGVYSRTDSSGSFRLGAFNASWQIGAGCSDLTERGFDCVQDQSVTVSNSDRTINFVASSAGSIRVITGGLSGGTVGLAYSAQLAASGGIMPVAWSLTPGSAPLPPGLTLLTAGVIQGVPITSGVFPFAVRVTDARDQFADQGLSLFIAPTPSFAQPELLFDGRVRLRLQNISAGQVYTIEASDDLRTWTQQITISASGNALEYTDALAPSLIRRFYRVRVGN